MKYQVNDVLVRKSSLSRPKIDGDFVTLEYIDDEMCKLRFNASRVLGFYNQVLEGFTLYDRPGNLDPNLLFKKKKAAQ